MNPEQFLCLAGNELSNGARVHAYINEACPPGFPYFADCDCFVLDLDETFVSPELDPAPWYVAANPESAEFLGFIADSIDLGATAARAVTPVDTGGAILGTIQETPRIIRVQGMLVATTAQGMAWGQRWLSAALRGSCGGCSADTLDILSACPDESDYDPERFFRTLLKVGLTEGPRFAAPDPNDAARLATVDFTLTAGLPYLFGPAEACLDEVTLGTGEQDCCLVETQAWNADKALRIVVEAGILGAQDVDIELRPTFDGECPTGPQMPCAAYHLTALDPFDRLTIDGRLGEAVVRDATSKTDKSALSVLDFDGLLAYPIVAPCSRVCVCVTNNGGNAVTVTVESYERET